MRKKCFSEKEMFSSFQKTFLATGKAQNMPKVARRLNTFTTENDRLHFLGREKLNTCWKTLEECEKHLGN